VTHRVQCKLASWKHPLTSPKATEHFFIIKTWNYQPVVLHVAWANAVQTLWRASKNEHSFALVSVHRALDWGRWACRWDHQSPRSTDNLRHSETLQEPNRKIFCSSRLVSAGRTEFFCCVTLYPIQRSLTTKRKACSLRSWIVLELGFIASWNTIRTRVSSTTHLTLPQRLSEHCKCQQMKGKTA